MFAVVRENPSKTEVLFKGSEEDCLGFIAESMGLWNDESVFVAPLE